MRGLSVALVVVALAGVLGLVGCNDSGGNYIYLNVSERAAWSVQDVLAFAAFGGNGLRYIYTINSNGGSLRLITPSSNSEDDAFEGGWHPWFSPDGAYIYFAGRRDLGGDTSVNLLRMDAGSGLNVVQLTQDAATDEMPCVSPDGTQIAFVSDRANGNRDVYVMGIAGEPGEVPVRLTTAAEEDAWPTWDPSGDRIYFHRVLSETDSDIRYVDVNTLVESAAVGNTAVREEAPAPYALPGAPDTLFLMHSNRAGDFDIWSGGMAPQTQITGDPRSDGFPVWNPNDTEFAFTRDRELWKSSADGTAQERLTRRF
jgi:Tol biopolymer transport system component